MLKEQNRNAAADFEIQQQIPTGEEMRGLFIIKDIQFVGSRLCLRKDCGCVCVYEPCVKHMSATGQRLKLQRFAVTGMILK